MYPTNSGAFSRDFSSLRHTASASTSALPSPRPSPEGLRRHLRCLHQHHLRQNNFFHEGFRQTALQEGLRQNHDDSPLLTRQHKGALPTPSLSTPALPPSTPFTGGPFQTSSANHNNMPPPTSSAGGASPTLPQLKHLFSGGLLPNTFVVRPSPLAKPKQLASMNTSA